jgi:predicted acylesterase/phospholipase RssA
VDADLVLEGGGVKGIGLVGAYTKLTDAGYTFHRIAGTSAGAIVGSLIAAGMDPAQLKQVMREVDYGRFQDEGFIDHLGMVGKGLSLLFEKGIYEGNYLREFLSAQLEPLGVKTFADLKIDDPQGSLPPEKQYRLVVMASDVTRARLVRLPWDYAQYGLDPDAQPVAEAVRASMSIPFFYEPLQFKSLDPEGKEEISYMVDGGMLSNYHDRGLRPHRRPAAAVAHVRHQALGQARRRAAREGDGRNDDELPRPDPHRRPRRARPHDVRGHVRRARDRLRHRRDDAGHAFQERAQDGEQIPRRLGLRRVRQDVPQRRRRADRRERARARGRGVT